MGKNSMIKRIAPEMDCEIRKLQADLMKRDNKPVKYVEASRLYAMASFTGKTDLMTAIRKMDTFRKL